MDIFTLYFLEFLSGLMKDSLNFLKCHSQQMVSTRGTPITSQAVFWKAHGSRV
jgi:hypothetical protein